MDLTEFALRTTLLATPGIAACKILEAMTGRRYGQLWRAAVDALLYSTLSYLVLALLLATFWSRSPTLGFLDSEEPIQWNAVGGATVIAVLIAASWTHVGRRGTFYSVGVRLGLTSRISKDDVWSEFLDPKQHLGWKRDWYFVRDHGKDLLYYGAIAGWSDSGESRELVMEDVSVCEGRTGRVMFKTEVLYLAADRHALTMEAPSEQAP